MIEIDEKDMPITVARKLIKARIDVTNDTKLAKAVNSIIGWDGKADAFTCDELMEIAEYLRVYCKHNGKTKIDNANEEEK